MPPPLHWDAPVPFSLPYRGERLRWAVQTQVGWSAGECARRLHMHRATFDQMLRNKRFIPDVVGFWAETLAAIHMANPPPPLSLWRSAAVSDPARCLVDFDLRPVPDHFPEEPCRLSLPYPGARMRWALEIIGWSEPTARARIHMGAAVMEAMFDDREVIPDALAMWLEGLAAAHIAMPYPVGWRSWSDRNKSEATEIA